MKDQITNNIEKLKNAQTSSEEQDVIDALTQIGEAAIPKLVDVVRTLPRSMAIRNRFMRVFRNIGYPNNTLALPLIVDIAADINSPSWDAAVDILKEIGSPIIPELREALHTYSQGSSADNLAVEGLCSLMEQLGSPIIDPLMPELLYLLGREDGWFDFVAILPITRIGSPKANTAVPILMRKISDSTRERTRQASIEALQSFDPSVIQPFILVLKECLLDESEVIRSSAQKVLASLEK